LSFAAPNRINNPVLKSNRQDGSVVWIGGPDSVKIELTTPGSCPQKYLQGKVFPGAKSVRQVAEPHEYIAAKNAGGISALTKLEMPISTSSPKPSNSGRYGKLSRRKGPLVPANVSAPFDETVRFEMLPGKNELTGFHWKSNETSIASTHCPLQALLPERVIIPWNGKMVSARAIAGSKKQNTSVSKIRINTHEREDISARRTIGGLRRTYATEILDSTLSQGWRTR